MADTAGVARLKARLSEYLARVKAGEEVVITERGRPVARLVPIGAGRGEERERLSSLVRRGEVRAGTGKLPPGFREMPRPKDAEGGVRAAVSEEREAGR